MTVESVLKNAGITDIDAVRQFAPHTEVFEPEELAIELKALVERNQVGKARVIVYQGLWALKVNWNEVVFNALPAGAGGTIALLAGVLTGDTLGVAGGVAGLVSTLAVLVGAGKIEFGIDHGQVVIALWKGFDGTNPVPRAALNKSLPDITPDRLIDILNDLSQLHVIGFVTEGAIEKRDELIVSSNNP